MSPSSPTQNQLPPNHSQPSRKNAKKNVATIPLSLRGKKRYILFHLHVEGAANVPAQRVDQALHAHMQQSFGSLGLPYLRFRFIQFDSYKGKGIVRCAHYAKDAVISALVLFSQFDGKPATLRTLQTSGTIKSLMDAFHQ